MNNIEPNISADMKKRYTERYLKLGRDIKTLGWGNKTQQESRFDQTLSTGLTFLNKNILDIGCGFGDYYHFLKKSQVAFGTYSGYDLNPHLIKEAKLQAGDSPDCSFYVENVLDSPTRTEYDIGLMLGVCNVNLHERVDNYNYAGEVMTRAFERVSEALIVDFLSYERVDSYPKEDFVFYYRPSKILEMALNLTRNVVLNHSYAPLPQKEFMIILKK